MFQSLFVLVINFLMQSASNIPVAAPTPMVVSVKTLPIQPTIPLIPTPTSTTTPTVIPTTRPTITPKPTSTPHDESLLTAVNTYRKEQNRSQIITHPLLCSITNLRVKELNSRGSLDNHEGIKKYLDQLLNTFTSWHEVMYMSSLPKPSDEIVRQGWAASDPHKQSISHEQVDYGCGAQENGFAVFILSKKK